MTHVGLYIGEGSFIHSATRGVQVSVLSGEDPYGRWWYKRWVGSRRIVRVSARRLSAAKGACRHGPFAALRVTRGSYSWRRRWPSAVVPLWPCCIPVAAIALVPAVSVARAVSPRTCSDARSR